MQRYAQRVVERSGDKDCITNKHPMSLSLSLSLPLLSVFLSGYLGVHILIDGSFSELGDQERHQGC
jgi:hypothetical protein